jgi:hypothetical protein
VDFMKRRLVALRSFAGTTTRLLFTPWNFSLTGAETDRVHLTEALRYLFSMIVLFVLIWQLPVALRQTSDNTIVLRLLGGIVIAEDVVVFFLALTPLMLWYRSGWRMPLVCIMYAVGAVIFVDVIWAGAKIALAIYPNEWTNPYLESCRGLIGYACREDIILRRLQSASTVVGVLESLWSAAILFALLLTRWSAPVVPTAAAVTLPTFVVAFYGNYLALPILELHRMLIHL